MTYKQKAAYFGGSLITLHYNPVLRIDNKSSTEVLLSALRAFISVIHLLADLHKVANARAFV